MSRPALVLASLVALVSLGGTAVAAKKSKWVIKSDKQIAPKVIKKLKGTRGPAGPAGAAGPAGPAGPAGARGATGANGTAGSAGPAGPKGETGATGAKGDKGDTGSAGPAGPAGPEGDEGDKGDKGDKGDTGDTGPIGPSNAFYAGTPDPSGIDDVVVGGTPTTVKSLTLQAGSYLLMARTRLRANLPGNGPNWVGRCDLVAGSTTVDTVSSQTHNTSTALQTVDAVLTNIAPLVVSEADAPQTVVVRCSGGGGNSSAESSTTAFFRAVTAIRTGSLTTTP